MRIEQAARTKARGQNEVRALINSLAIIATSAMSAIVSQMENVT